MKWVRAWPDPLPEGRNYVVDQLPRVPVNHYDYSALATVNDEPICLLDWDMAMAPENMAAFAAVDGGRAAPGPGGPVPALSPQGGMGRLPRGLDPGRDG